MRDRVDLIDHKNDRCLAALKSFRNELISAANEFVRLDKPQYQVNTFHGSSRHLLHILAKLVLCLVNARRIKEDDLSPVIREYGFYSVSRRLRLVARDRDLLTDDAVHER